MPAELHIELASGNEAPQRRLRRNLQRPHQALGGLVPADRFFRAAPQVREAIERTVAGNALRLAHQRPTVKPFYLVGRMGDRDVSIAADAGGLRVRLGDEQPQRIDLGKEEQHGEEVPNRRYMLLMGAATGRLSVAEPARRLGMSRNLDADLSGDVKTTTLAGRVTLGGWF